jgi:hypothetical protein
LNNRADFERIVREIGLDILFNAGKATSSDTSNVDIPTEFVKNSEHVMLLRLIIQSNIFAARAEGVPNAFAKPRRYLTVLFPKGKELNMLFHENITIADVAYILSIDLQTKTKDGFVIKTRNSSKQLITAPHTRKLSELYEWTIMVKDLGKIRRKTQSKGRPTR